MASMASTLKTPFPLLSSADHSSILACAWKRLPVPSLKQRRPLVIPLLPKVAPFHPRNPTLSTPLTWASYGETTETDQVEEAASNEKLEEETTDQHADIDGGITEEEEKTEMALTALLQSYKEALENDDQTTVSDSENFLLSLEKEKESLALKVASLSQELQVEKDRLLRISADFDNFRKRTENERLSLMTNAQGEVVGSLLPVLDNFERAKSQIKLETEGEEKINNSYQSIYKQFVEILNSLGVEAIETIACEFDPMLHEAIMQEESTEFGEGIILEEFRRGFKLGDRLLRPAMVKVSSGPGPQKSEEAPESAEEVKDDSETIVADQDDEGNA